MKRSFISAELMRYVKRSSRIEYFLTTKARFWTRLRARGYPEKFLGPIFARIVYADRWKFLHFTAQLTSALKQPRVRPTPAATLAMTLPHTQRVSMMEVQQALILVSERSLTKIYEVPDVLRTARYLCAKSMGRNLGAHLLDFHYPRRGS